MTIHNISVTDLFGRYRYSIPINHETGVTLIHGVNGAGKTTLLELVHALLSGKLEVLIRIPFSAFRVDLDEQTYLQAERIVNKKDAYDAPSIMLTYQNREGFHESFVYPSVSQSGVSELQLTFERYLDWMNDNRRHQLQKDVPSHKISTPVVLPAWFEDLRKREKTHFIGADRLFVRPQASLHAESTLKTAARELAQSMDAALAQSVTLAHDLDRTFPIRLIEKMVQSDDESEVPSEIEIDSRLESLEQRRSRLESVGLMNVGGPSLLHIDEDTDPHTRRVLSLYLDDMEQKLQVFDAFERRINLMLDIVNKRLRHKRISVNRSQGIVVHLDNGDELDLDDLSSGEQHQILMAYELLFRTEQNSLVLIDEPELSMHVAWQVGFVEDLIRIAHLNQLQMVVATHSPDIIADHWDLTVSLGEEAP